MTVDLLGATKRGKERDGHTTEHLPSLYQITAVHSLVSSLLSLVSPIRSFSVYVGLIEAFRHRIKASGNVPPRSGLEGGVPRCKEEMETKLIKMAQQQAKRMFFLGSNINQESLYFSRNKEEKLSSTKLFSRLCICH